MTNGLQAQSTSLEKSSIQTANSLSKDDQRVITVHKSNLKIREYALQDYEQLTARLMAIAKSIGVITPPDKEMMTTILETLKNQFPDFSMQEISIAFEYGFGGKIDVNVTNYNSFNVIYLTNILKAYKAYRAETIKKELSYQRLNEKEESMKTIDVPEEEKQKRLCEGLLKIVESEGKIPWTWDWEAVFFHLQRIKEINDTNEEKAEFLIKVRDRLKAEAKFEERMSQKADILDQVNNPEKLKLECRKQRVIIYLKTCLPI